MYVITVISEVASGIPPQTIRRGYTKKISFPDSILHHMPNMAQNEDQGSIQAYSFFRPVTGTGLIGALFIANSRITDT